MRSASRRRRWLLLGLGLALLAAGLPATVQAHNPGQTIYHPVPVDEKRLVVGAEGAWALLTPEGNVTERGNLSVQGEVLSAPVTHEGTALVAHKRIPELTARVQAFDADGPTWGMDLTEREAHAYTVANEEGFGVFTNTSRQVTLSPEGEVLADRELAVRPAVAPSPAADGWWLPTPEELALVVDGEVRDAAAYAGTPTDVTLAGDHVLVSLAEPKADRATLRAYDQSLELDWTRPLEGLRLGGSPAVLEDRVVVGTYHPSGARLVALDRADGSVLWEENLPNATAAAPTVVEGDVVVAANEAILAFAPDGEELWTREASPVLDSPALVDGTIVASGADNRLQALHPNGTLAWTYNDAIEIPNWTHHQADRESGTDENENDGTDDPQANSTPWIGVPALASLAAIAAVLGRRGRIE